MSAPESEDRKNSAREEPTPDPRTQRPNVTAWASLGVAVVALILSQFRPIRFEAAGVTRRPPEAQVDQLSVILQETLAEVWGPEVGPYDKALQRTG